MSARPMATRIAVLNSHPIQYLAPLYAFLNADPGLEITALYLSNCSIRGERDKGFGKEVRWDIDLLAGYRSVFVGKAVDTNVPEGGFLSLITPELWGELRSGRYDILWLNGHNYAANHVALAAAKSARMPVMMRSDTHLALERHGLKAALRRPVLGAFYGLCDCFLAIGTANEAFYRAMGVHEEKIFRVPFAVDNDRFMSTARIGVEERRAVRRQFGIAEDAPAILFASKFQKRQRPDDLIRAGAKLVSAGLRFHIIMIGMGEMDGELRSLVAELGLDNVVFAGFVNQSALPRVLSSGDVFVLPSEDEPWGLIVNEAMCAGLPVIVSNEVGCAADLVRQGGNGLTFRAGDIDGLAAALRPVLENAELRRRMSHASLTRISDWGYPHCLQGVRAAVSYLSARSQRPMEVGRNSD
jgi:glycosyltransferase involved in cell wall biosynthesis